MNLECLTIKGEMFCVLSVISLFTAKYKNLNEHQSVLIP